MQRHANKLPENEWTGLFCWFSLFLLAHSLSPTCVAGDTKDVGENPGDSKLHEVEIILRGSPETTLKARILEENYLRVVCRTQAGKRIIIPALKIKEIQYYQVVQSYKNAVRKLKEGSFLTAATLFHQAMQKYEGKRMKEYCTYSMANSFLKARHKVVNDCLLLPIHPTSQRNQGKLPGI